MVANYSGNDISGDINWEIINRNGNVLQDGTIAGTVIEKGGLRIIGELHADLSSVSKAQKLTLSCSVSGTGYGNSLILDNTSSDYRPIVQVIDNVERNHKMGLIFEFKSGEGKLLVCMSRLNQLTDTPQGFQLYQSIIHYMGSDDFEPYYELSRDELIDLFTE
jgi:hypothetical protein